MDKNEAMDKNGAQISQATDPNLTADALPPEELLRKKLRWRAWHRGTQELDLMLGTFADRFLAEMDLQTLQDFELFMLAEDPEIQSWLQGDKPFPSDLPDSLAALFARYDFLSERLA